MRWISSVVQDTDPLTAAHRLADALLGGLAGEEAHLVLLFCAGRGPGPLAEIVEVLRARLPTARLVGCTGGSVLASGREVEGQTALAALAGHLPDVAVLPFKVGPELLQAASSDPGAWTRQLDVIPEQQPIFILLPDPFTCDATRLLSSLDAAFPLAPKIGGMVSGSREPGHHRLILDGALHAGGAVGLCLYGDVALDPIVAQGARPVGPLLQVSAATQNRLQELDSEPASQVLERVWQGLSAEDRARFQKTPLVGLVEGESSSGRLRRGDYLVRNIVGVDRKTEEIAVGGPVTADQLLRFHVRDAATSSEDLHDLLARWSMAGRNAAAALIFTCLGRGEAFFGVQDHDSRVVAEVTGGVPSAGFFCNGELGPVHGHTQLHGYTCCVGLLRPRAWS
jgi:small ligand-binding sensory domain FIST